MRTRTIRALGKGIAVAGFALLATVEMAEAQRRGNRGQPAAVVDIAFRVDAGTERAIRSFYAERPVSGAKALPPGIRRNLARGKPLPPGIAQKTAPSELVSVLSLPPGYQVVEVGLDVVIVDVATAVVHDILMDVIR